MSTTDYVGKYVLIESNYYTEACGSKIYKVEAQSAKTVVIAEWDSWNECTVGDILRIPQTKVVALSQTVREAAGYLTHAAIIQARASEALVAVRAYTEELRKRNGV